MKICIVSGKGGTGKTTVSVGLATALAATDKGMVKLLDCDVEEPNAHLYLRPDQMQRREVTVAVPLWDSACCSACGACKKVCAFGAMALFGDHLEIFQEHCHSCGACIYVCPEMALKEESRPIGLLHQGKAEGLEVVWGELAVGEPRPVPVIEAVREAAEEADHVIIDGPPGTSCALVAAAGEADAALVVTEPTPFGLHDLALALDVLQELAVPAAVLLNKAGEEDAGIRTYCRSRGIPMLLEIPFEKSLARTGAEALSLTQAAPEWGPVLQGLWRDLETLVSEGRA